jgi:hypothetical protein
MPSRHTASTAAAQGRSNSKEFKARAFAWLNNQIKARVAMGAYPPTVFLVAYELVTAYFNEKEGGAAWPALKTLAKAIGKSEGTVANLVRRMEAAGDLRVMWGKQGSGHSNHYWMVEKPQRAEVSKPQKTSKTRVPKPQSTTEKTSASCSDPYLENHGGISTEMPPQETESGLLAQSDDTGAGSPVGARANVREEIIEAEVIAPEAPQRCDGTVTPFEPPGQRDSAVTLIAPGEDYAELTAIWQRPWIDDPAADRRAFDKACREITPETIIEAAQRVARVVEPRYRPSLSKWLAGRGWEKAPPSDAPPQRARRNGRRYGGKPDMTAVMLKQAGWQEGDDGVLTDPDTGRTYGGLQ